MSHTDTNGPAGEGAAQKNLPRATTQYNNCQLLLGAPEIKTTTKNPLQFANHQLFLQLFQKYPISTLYYFTFYSAFNFAFRYSNVTKQLLVFFFYFLIYFNKHLWAVGRQAAPKKLTQS